ncbi:saccharopine dehydrogenase [Truncatella angustata]|uniref:Saccharopine dehydrogenase [NAD(+), L-lysine-forming] n=1 Tax=Truncatella angustata TaxID=152316 RepID=A0A9P8URL8_9PEZI|nr:saccharopine dehydrogenase [Truncatella angustata]KAH6656978.1 saccharopine dehydrogenase [Truncatella angustata]
MSPTVLHLRSEDKPLEHRSALTPTTAKALIDAGYTVNVEKSPVRIFDDAEFEKIGAALVPTGSWREAPKEHIVVGLKELPEETFPLKHVHVQFAHCYKQQGGWDTVLARFPRGGGTLLDLEFLQDPKTKRRVAAFGYSAGFSGSALALKTWSWQLTHPGEPLPGVESYPNEGELIADIKKDIVEGQKKVGRLPRVIVIGALGRCGRGAVDMALKAGVPESQILKWDMAETAKGGPFDEILESDIFVNCIYLNEKIPHFVDLESLKKPGRKLSVVCDVSADTTNPNNPIPIYTIATTFKEPTVPVEGVSDPPVSVISIDHLPSLLPRESSEAFSGDLLPYLLKLNDWQNDPVWAGAKDLFDEKVNTLPKEALNQ